MLGAPTVCPEVRTQQRLYPWPAPGLGISVTVQTRAVRLDQEQLPASPTVVRVQPGSGGVSLSLPVQGVRPPHPSSTSGAVRWGSVCFLLFAKGSHSLSSAVFIIGLGTHLPQPPTVPEGCQVTQYTVYPLLRRVPLRALARCALSCPCQCGTGRLWCGRVGLRGQGPQRPASAALALSRGDRGPGSVGATPAPHGLGHLWGQQA